MCTIYELFSLSPITCVVTSPPTIVYDSVAWAADEDARVWAPDLELGTCYWPPGVPQERTLNAFTKLFMSMGYEILLNTQPYELESDFQRIAIYIDSRDRPTHVARQLPTGKWTSKLPSREDIQHDSPACLEGTYFGYVAKTMRRPIHKIGELDTN
jgi:hypothetical protein